MSGFKHSWNGTILTITSDSGTSSADLKGSRGDLGPRGPQGPAGISVGEGGSVDLSGYATEKYVDDKLASFDIEDFDLSNYYTKSEVDKKVGEAGGEVYHSWNGSVLTVTTSSGTSSADLRGPKGADGTMIFEDLTDEQREDLRGPAGKDGKDYVLTTADKNEIATVVKNAVFSFNASTGRLDITV